MPSYTEGMALLRSRKKAKTTAPDGSEVDRKFLKTVSAEFTRHHRARAQAVGLRLDARQRVILEALPVLLHSNHPALPGHIDADCPAGIEQFEPSKTQQLAAGRLAAAYRDEGVRDVERSLHGVYLMGSGGSVGQTQGSDIDLWVAAPAALHDGLGAKLQAISHWAAKQNLTIQGFAVDPEDFQRGVVPGVRSPNLLLDEFYRSATWLAGRLPLWWLVAAEQQDFAAYGDFLTDNRFVEAGEFIDFGPVRRPSGQELLSAGVSQLDACFDTPHKSLMKLLLIESYAVSNALLSDQYKRVVYQQAEAGEPNDDELDTYVLLYRHLEAYLGQREEAERLELVRRCFIRKTAAPQWRETPLPGLLAEWGIEGPALNRLKKPRTWPLSTLAAEGEAIDVELHRAYTLLRQLAEQTSDDSHNHELSRIARLLGQREGDRPGMLKLINPAVLPDSYEGRVRLEHRSADESANARWQLTDSDGTLMQHARLTGALSWAVLTGLTASQIDARTLTSGAERHKTLLRLLRERSGAIALINAEEDDNDRDSALVTSRDDALEFSGFHHNLVSTVDLLINTADEPTHLTFRGDDALLQAFATLHRSGEQASWHCVTELRGQLIEQRIKRLYEHFRAGVDKAKRHVGGRFLFALGGRFGLIEIGSKHVRSEILADERALCERLSAPTTSPVLWADPDSSRLKFLRELIAASNERCAFAIAPPAETQNSPSKPITLYLRDGGCIHRFVQPKRPTDEVAGSWLLFFASRIDGEPPRILLRSDDSLRSYRPNSVRLPFRVSLREREDGNVDIQCGDRAWQGVPMVEATIDAVIEAILSRRTSGELYPVYLTEVHLRSDNASLADAMRLKTRTEQAIWRRMQRRA